MYISKDEYTRLAKAEKELKALQALCVRLYDNNANLVRASTDLTTVVNKISTIIKEN